MTQSPYEPPTGWEPPPAGEPAPPSGSPAGNPPPGHGPPPGYGAPPPAWGGAPAQAPPPWHGSQDPLWAVLAHVSLYVFPLLGPLVVYLVYKDTQPFTRQHAAEALNLALTLLIATVVSAVLIFVIIGIPMLIVLVVWGMVAPILGAVAAGNRRPYRYPATIHFVS